jgi:hypothetical protein
MVKPRSSAAAALDRDRFTTPFDDEEPHHKPKALPRPARPSEVHPILREHLAAIRVDDSTVVKRQARPPKSTSASALDGDAELGPRMVDLFRWIHNARDKAKRRGRTLSMEEIRAEARRRGLPEEDGLKRRRQVRRAAEDARITGRRHHVLTEILECTNNATGVAWIGIRRIRTITQSTNKTIEADIAFLRDAGFLEIFHRKGKNGTNLYRVSVPSPEQIETAARQAFQRSKRKAPVRAAVRRRAPATRVSVSTSRNAGSAAGSRQRVDQS